MFKKSISDHVNYLMQQHKGHRKLNNHILDTKVRGLLKGRYADSIHTLSEIFNFKI